MPPEEFPSTIPPPEIFVNIFGGDDCMEGVKFPFMDKLHLPFNFVRLPFCKSLT